MTNLSFLIHGLCTRLHYISCAILFFHILLHFVSLAMDVKFKLFDADTADDFSTAEINKINFGLIDSKGTRAKLTYGKGNMIIVGSPSVSLKYDITPKEFAAKPGAVSKFNNSRPNVNANLVIEVQPKVEAVQHKNSDEIDAQHAQNANGDDSDENQDSNEDESSSGMWGGAHAVDGEAVVDESPLHVQEPCEACSMYRAVDAISRRVQVLFKKCKDNVFGGLDPEMILSRSQKNFKDGISDTKWSEYSNKFETTLSVNVPVLKVSNKPGSQTHALAIPVYDLESYDPETKQYKRQLPSPIMTIPRGTVVKFVMSPVAKRFNQVREVRWEVISMAITVAVKIMGYPTKSNLNEDDDVSCTQPPSKKKIKNE